MALEAPLLVEWLPPMIKIGLVTNVRSVVALVSVGG
jgi:hypothetical protein